MLPPISVNTVRTVVEAISNSQTIPEHLLSSLLSRRHHFLSISPSDRRDYLSWQSQDQSRVLDLVNALPYPPGDIQYGVQYTSEGGEGDTFAHVCAGHPPDAAQQDNRDVLRLVFRWEDPGWKYHNAALMPFPRDSHPSVSAALHAIAPAGPATSAPGPASASVSTPGPLPHPQVKLIIDHVASNCMDQSDSDDDSYWNAYARTGDSPNSSVSSLPRRSRLDEDDKLAQQNEDAYWARYTTVQGTADSTIPSPLHSRKPVPLPPQFINHITRPAPQPSAGDPPSARALAERLGNLCPRRRRADSPIDLGVPVSVSDDGHGWLGSSQGEGEVLEDTASVGGAAEEPIMLMFPEEPRFKTSRDNDALAKGHIQDLYRLWLERRGDRDGIDDRDDFLRVVREAIGL